MTTSTSGLQQALLMALMAATPFALSLPAVAQPAQGESAMPVALILETNEQRPWTLPENLERIAIADPSIADLTRMGSGRQSLLVGKSPGATTLLLWHRNAATPQRIRIEVRTPVQQALPREARASLITHQDQAAITGASTTALAHQQLYSAAAAQGVKPAQIHDAAVIGHSGQVQVEVKVVEFSKSVMRQIGLNFQKSNGSFEYAIGNGVGGEGGNAVSSAFNLIASSGRNNWSTNINLLQANGMARVLAEPTLVAMSGQSASFLAGGELPILEPQGLGSTTITFKPFGIGLTVTPTVLSPDRIALKVAPEASDLDYARGITLDGVQVPAITTRRADTAVELGDGETFIIGGLVSSQTSAMVNKVPLLGDIPIIGNFFRNLNQKEEEKELVILVTPRLVRPIARDTELVLPGDQQSRPNLPVWGSYLLSPMSSDPLPGFSR